MPANSTAVPSPYVAIPTKQWDGDDGSWSTFRISVGQPGHSQDFRVLVSTRGDVAWVPTHDGCNANDQKCPYLRGVETFEGNASRGFQPDQSHTWKDIGLISLDLETNLGYNDEGGDYGFDTVRLGFAQDKKALEVNNTQVVGIQDPNYYMGLLGMSNAESSVSNTDDAVKSFIQSLNDTNQIPSQSYAYTAGAYYRHKGVPGSLVIGGYDQSRFESPSYNFSFAPDLNRFLKVGVQSIKTNFSLTTRGPLELAGSLGNFSDIDSTISHLWLPQNVCDKFADAFNLTHDAESNYYLISDTVREKLLVENPTFTFMLGNDYSFSPIHSISINLPYRAFDHSIGPPAYPNTTHYFPIRRASSDDQYTIGRVFLQEAYLIVDYERGQFTLAQANFSTDPSQQPLDIRTIFSKNYVAPTPPSGLSSGAKAGIAIGVVAGLVLLFGAMYLCWYRPRHRRRVEKRQREASVVSAAPPYTENAIPPNYAEDKPYDPYYATGGPEQPATEMPASTEHQTARPELEGGGGSYELPALTGAVREVPVHEMDAGNADAAGGEGGGEEERERRASAAVGPTER